MSTRCILCPALVHEWEITLICGAGWKSSLMQISQNFIHKSSAFHFSFSCKIHILNYCTDNFMYIFPFRSGKCYLLCPALELSWNEGLLHIFQNSGMCFFTSQICLCFYLTCLSVQSRPDSNVMGS